MDAIKDFEIKIEEPDTDNWSLISRPIQDYQLNVHPPPFATHRMLNSIESHPPVGPFFNFLENNPIPQVVLFPQNRHTETLTLPILRGANTPEPPPIRYRPPETKPPLVSLLKLNMKDRMDLSAAIFSACFALCSINQFWTFVRSMNFKEIFIKFFGRTAT